MRNAIAFLSFSGQLGVGSMSSEGAKRASRDSGRTPRHTRHFRYWPMMVTAASLTSAFEQRRTSVERPPWAQVGQQRRRFGCPPLAQSYSGSPLVVLTQVSVERTFLGHRLTDANDPEQTLDVWPHLRFGRP